MGGDGVPCELGGGGVLCERGAIGVGPSQIVYVPRVELLHTIKTKFVAVVVWFLPGIMYLR